MSLLIEIIQEGLRVEAHRPWPRVIVTADTWNLASVSAGRRAYDASGPVGGPRHRQHGAHGRGSRSASASSRSHARMAASPRSARCMRRRSVWSAPCAISTAWSRRACPTLGRGSIMGAGRCSTRSAPSRMRCRQRRRMHSCRSKARACTRSRSGRCMPGSSSRDISGSPPMARRWCGSNSGWAMSTRGSNSLMLGADLERGARLAARTCGDSTVAYALAFAHAAEAALGITAPPRAAWLRALMAELERLANHLGDFGAICNDASFSIMHAQTGILRERMLRAAAACFGHRLMMDGIVPGGVAIDLAPDGAAQIAHLSPRSAASFPGWWSSMTTPLRCRIARSRPAFSSPRSPAGSGPAASWAAPRAEPSMRGGRSSIRPTMRSRSMCRCSRPATSMRGSGSGFARSSRASA